MYSIRWYNGSCTLVGNMRSVLQLAKILNKNENEFKIADVVGCQLSQLSVGCGGYKYWLDPNDTFT